MDPHAAAPQPGLPAGDRAEHDRLRRAGRAALDPGHHQLAAGRHPDRHLLGSADLGIYSIAYRLPEVGIASVAYALGVVAFPALARRRTDDSRGLGPATLQLVRYMSLYALPVATALAVLSVPVIDLLFSHKWHEAARLLVPIAVAAAVYTVVYPLGDLLKAVGKQATIVKINVILVPLMIAACVLAAPAGLLTISWALVGTSATFAVLMAVAVALQLRRGRATSRVPSPPRPRRRSACWSRPAASAWRGRRSRSRRS